ncbi:MAG TPA: hypothetical protein ENI92_01130, partial [Bacteroidetes bacterium]|nr:hypothetical protein [Bacteroidota bacterium]
MDKEKMPVIVGIFVVGYIIFFIANFILLKATVKWPEQPPADTLQQEEPSEELSLTWDISGKTGPPKELEKEFQRKQREQTLSIVDSIVTKETQPLKQQVAE